MFRRYGIFAAITIWAGLAAMGLFYLQTYAKTPGDHGTPISNWPPTALLQLATDRYTGVMFVHPRCACSRASVAELARLSAKLGEKFQTTVVFTLPPGMADFSDDQALWEQTVRIPSVSAVRDPEGKEARLFGSKTSGHMLVFNAYGKNIFSGGITQARGHEGDNAGAQMILNAVNYGLQPTLNTSIFGCSLFDKTITGLAEIF